MAAHRRVEGKVYYTDVATRAKLTYYEGQLLSGQIVLNYTIYTFSILNDVQLCSSSLHSECLRGVWWFFQQTVHHLSTDWWQSRAPVVYCCFAGFQLSHSTYRVYSDSWRWKSWITYNSTHLLIFVTEDIICSFFTEAMWSHHFSNVPQIYTSASQSLALLNQTVWGSVSHSNCAVCCGFLANYDRS